MRVVAYVRVSTDKQGKSGLGLEAQIATINGYVAQNSAELVATYSEVESGKRNDRPQLAKALAHARKAKATLVIAKLDRLSRDAHFLLGLQKGGVPFIICDMPYADTFTVGILALVAQKERELISARTKAALAAAKARGVKLGSPTASQTARGATIAKREQAQARAKSTMTIIRDIERSGITSLSGIARALEARGVMTPRGNLNWAASQVAHIRSLAA